MSAISTETLSLGYGETIIIDELNLTIPKVKSPYLSAATAAVSRLSFGLSHV